MLFRVVDILRLPNELNTPHSFTFYIVLFGTKYKIHELDPEQADDIVKGLVYKNDFVSIKDNKIEVKDKMYTESEIDLQSDKEFLSDLKIRYLPFLTDTPLIPFCDIQSANMTIENQVITVTTEEDSFEATSLLNPLKKESIVAKILYKSRVLTCRAACPYFFYVVLTDGISYLKLYFWRHNAKYFQAINPGDTIAIKNYSKNSKKYGDPRINTYQETFIIDCQSIQLCKDSSVYKIDHEISKDNVDITQTRYYYKQDDRYHMISGNLVFMSVLLRKRNLVQSFVEHKDKIIEYFLLKILDGDESYSVVLFNNSQNEFDDLTVNRKITITNLWKIKRGDYDFYTNSIYTQIEFGKETSDNAIDTRLSQEKENNPKKLENHTSENVLCFLPDKYNSYTDVTSQNENYAFNLDCDITNYFKIFETTIKDINIHIENLVLSEHKKFYFAATLDSFDFNSVDETINEQSFITFDYQTEKGDKKLQTGTVTFSDNDTQIDVLVFKNLFAGDNCVFDKFSVSSEKEMMQLLSKKFIVIIDACRISKQDIIISLSMTYEVKT